MEMENNSSPRKSLALKEQEQMMDGLKKENFSLKLRVHFLEETLSRLASSDVSADIQHSDLLTEHVELQIKYETLQKEYENVQRNHNSSGVVAVLEETVTAYRRDIEKLEDDLSDSKTQIFSLNSQLSQRAVEIEQLRGENESLKLQISSVKSATVASNGQGLSRNASFADTTIFNNSFDDETMTNFIHPIPNQQLEKGIALLRDQISDLKMQLIEKSSNSDQLLHEIESKNQLHARSLGQMQDNWHREELKLKNTIAELREQLARAKSEAQQISIQYETIQRSHYSEESQLHLELQNMERQLQIKSEKLSDSLQQVDKLSAQVKTLESTLTLKKSHIDQLTRQLDSKNNLVQTAEKDHGRVLDQLHTKISTLQHELSEATMNLQTKDTEAQILKEQIERQKNNLVSVEERWSKQTKDISKQQQDIRHELEQNIQQFKSKVAHLSEQLNQKDSELKEYKTQLEMHSIGLEESTRSNNQEKERLRKELATANTDLENTKRELARWQHQLNELDISYKDSVGANDRLQNSINQFQEKLQKLSHEISDKDRTVRQKETELKEKTQIIMNLNQRLLDSENYISEGQQIVGVIEQRFNHQVDERNNLLGKIHSFLLKFLSTNHLSQSVTEFTNCDSSENFFGFADEISEMLNCLNKFPSQTEQKIKVMETRLMDDLRNMNAKLDRKLVQLEKFEMIVKEAVSVQKRMRDSLNLKQQELHDARIENGNLSQQISILHHEMTTLKSEAAISSSNDRAKILELQSSVSELERRVRERERKLKETSFHTTELEDGLSKQKQSATHRVNELAEHVRILRKELEISQKHNSQLEELLKNDKGSLTRKSSMQTLLETSEAALEKLQRQYSEQVETLRNQLEREKTKTGKLDDILSQLKRENEKIRMKLEKRETMIEMALSKLELVSRRKGSLEQTLLQQFTDDVKNVISDSASTSEPLETRRNE